MIKNKNEFISLYFSKYFYSNLWSDFQNIYDFIVVILMFKEMLNHFTLSVPCCAVKSVISSAKNFDRGKNLVLPKVKIIP